MSTCDYQIVKTRTPNARNKYGERVFRDRMLDHTRYLCNRNADGTSKTRLYDYRKKNGGRVDTYIRESL